MDAAGELRGLVKVEARGEQRGVEKQPDQVLHSLVGLVCCCLLLQLGHDGVLGVHLHRLLGHHVRGHGIVAQSLRLHDALHVRRPAVLGRGQDARRVRHARADDDLLHLVTQTSFISLVSGSNSAFISSSFFFSSSSSRSRPSFVVDFSFLPSNSFSCCTEYSSMGSTMYRTSRPFFLRLSRNGEEETAWILSPVM